MTDTQERFAFGKNWEQFLKQFSEERAAIAKKNLLNSLQLPDLNGMTFLDIGSGSGLHSLSAWRAGAERVVSFDYDVNSVAATTALWKMAGEPKNWTVCQGSVLDLDFMKKLGQFDIVYSWGVLHHTGAMWQAIRNARIPLAANGTFFIALYSDITYRNASCEGYPTPEAWLRIKQEYNKATPQQKRRMEYTDVWQRFLANSFPHPIRFARACIALYRQIRDYETSRGMEFWTDIRDWLGGWPMEFVKENECILLCRENLGLECLRINTGSGNTEFIFRPTGSSNYWDDIIALRELVTLEEPFVFVDGFMWKTSVPSVWQAKNIKEFPSYPLLRMTENGILFGYQNAPHEGIRQFGEGRYSFWEDSLYFSTPDASDPNVNGRTYAVFIEPGKP